MLWLSYGSFHWPAFSPSCSFTVPTFCPANAHAPRVGSILRFACLPIGFTIGMRRLLLSRNCILRSLHQGAPSMNYTVVLFTVSSTFTVLYFSCLLYYLHPSVFLNITGNIFQQKKTLERKKIYYFHQLFIKKKNENIFTTYFKKKLDILSTAGKKNIHNCFFVL